MIDGIVYLIYNNITSKVYIGITIQDPWVRFLQHKSDKYRNKTKTKFSNAMRKYKFEDFFMQVLEENITSRELLNERETYWITYFDSTNDKYGYNTTSGGLHYERTPEMRAKTSAGKLASGYKHSEETKAKIREARSRYKHLSKEHKMNVSKGVRKIRKWSLSLEDAKQVLLELHQGKSITELKQKYNVSRDTIRRIKLGLCDMPGLYDTLPPVPTKLGKDITVWGETKNIKDWSKDKRCVVSYGTLRARILLGKDPEWSMTNPVGNKA